jgi:flagellar biosynthesis protein FlhB
MADQDQEQKTEQPTGKRLGEAMEHGQFARAQELQVFFSLLAVVSVLAFLGRPSVQRVAEFATMIFARCGSIPVLPQTVPAMVSQIMFTLAPVVLPLLGACCGAALLAGGLQSGFRLSPKALEPSWERFNPVAGLQRMYSKDIFARTGIDVLKVVAVAGTLFLSARKLAQDPLFSAPIEAAYLGQFIQQTAMAFFGRLLVAIGIIAAIRYAYEKVKTMRELMMTREEVKEERKSSEMDDKIKGARRRMARRLMQKQMLSAVPTADVVVTNPTHFAVALKYERGRDRAPVVLAKGEDRFAMRLKEIAAEHGVPTVENRSVARMLYAVGRVGETIPPELYQAVAEILAVVYRTHRYYFHRLRSRRLEAAV